MFRWVVCQLDNLRRLHQVSKIKEAIRSLPETLDETYERIFSCIPEEERGLVRCALHLLCLYNILSGGQQFPARVILDFYATLDSSENRPDPDDFLLDLDTLKDACGCLVSFSSKDGAEIANVAHYTVREFLESRRASGPLAASMKISSQDLRAILASMFEYTMGWIEDDKACDSIEGPPLSISAISSLGQCCVASSVLSLHKCQELVEPRLAFELLDPCQAHYENLRDALQRGDELEGTYSDDFWGVSWGNSCKSSKAVILASLLINKCFTLAKVFLRDLDKKEVMKEVLVGRPSSIWRMGAERVLIEGNLVEVLCQIERLDKGTLGFLHIKVVCLLRRVQNW